MTNKVLWNQQDNSDYEVEKMWEEIVSWKKILSCRMEENIQLKNILAEILRNNYDRNCLEEIEEFQTKFIRQDEIIDMLRKEVTNLDYLFLSKTFEDEKRRIFFAKALQRLRKDIAHSENNFRSLISSYEDFQQKICKKRVEIKKPIPD